MCLHLSHKRIYFLLRRSALTWIDAMKKNGDRQNWTLAKCLQVLSLPEMWKKKNTVHYTLVLFLPAAFLFQTLSFLFFQDLLNYALMCLGTSSDVVQDHDVIKQVLISKNKIRLVTPQKKNYSYWIMIRFQKFYPASFYVIRK